MKYVGIIILLIALYLIYENAMEKKEEKKEPESDNSGSGSGGGSSSSESTPSQKWKPRAGANQSSYVGGARNGTNKTNLVKVIRINPATTITPVQTRKN